MKNIFKKENLKILKVLLSFMKFFMLLWEYIHKYTNTSIQLIFISVVWMIKIKKSVGSFLGRNSKLMTSIASSTVWIRIKAKTMVQSPKI